MVHVRFLGRIPSMKRSQQIQIQSLHLELTHVFLFDLEKKFLKAISVICNSVKTKETLPVQINISPTNRTLTNVKFGTFF